MHCSIVFLATVFCVYANAEKVAFIVGGVEADIRKYPYQVSLRYLNELICGATIISSKHCLTAAHCYKKGRPSASYSILAGSTAVRGADARSGTIMQVKSFMVHENYNAIATVNDIAVLLLTNTLPLNGATIKVAPMPNQGEAVPFGKIGAVSGWGTMREGLNDLPINLRAVDVPIRQNADCVKAYGLNFRSPSQFCAGYPEGNRDSCQGDSGGPFAVSGKVFGVVSFGKGCGRRNIPGVYTSVAFFRNWIDKKMTLK